MPAEGWTHSTVCVIDDRSGRLHILQLSYRHHDDPNTLEEHIQRWAVARRINPSSVTWMEHPCKIRGLGFTNIPRWVMDERRGKRWTRHPVSR